MNRIVTNRRIFLKTAAASTLLLTSASVLSASVESETFTAGTQLNSRDKLLDTIEDSIQANFGSGFGVLSYSQKQGETYAQIEHLENYYKVVSTDLSDWKILHCSVS
jgi:hypothetical protein